MPGDETGEAGGGLVIQGLVDQVRESGDDTMAALTDYHEPGNGPSA